MKSSLKWLQQFVTKYLQDVVSLDSLESSHPISVHNTNEINEILDLIWIRIWIRKFWIRISYGKGTSVIRMLVAFIGEKTFLIVICCTGSQYGNGRTTSRQPSRPSKLQDDL